MREKKEQETVYDTGVNIDHNLRGIAERRTDIFGVGGEETEIGRKVRYYSSFNTANVRLELSNLVM